MNLLQSVALKLTNQEGGCLVICSHCDIRSPQLIINVLRMLHSYVLSTSDLERSRRQTGTPQPRGHFTLLLNHDRIRLPSLKTISNDWLSPIRHLARVLVSITTARKHLALAYCVLGVRLRERSGKARSHHRYDRCKTLMLLEHKHYLYQRWATAATASERRQGTHTDCSRVGRSFWPSFSNHDAKWKLKRHTSYCSGSVWLHKSVFVHCEMSRVHPAGYELQTQSK